MLAVRFEQLESVQTYLYYFYTTLSYLSVVFHNSDFKTRFKDDAPSSNADVGQTIAHLLGLNLKANGSLVGRVLEEALMNGRPMKHSDKTLQSPAAGDLRTILRYQEVGHVRYLDAAGFPSRTLGLPSPSPRKP